jgi:ribose 5-phosphate isomerase B
MKVSIGADHRGFGLKAELIKWLKKEGHVVSDVGNTVHDPDDDYVGFALKVGQEVSDGDSEIGVVICGSGVGVSVMANKIPGIRAVLAFNEDQVEHARERDDANVIALAADYTDTTTAKDYIHEFMTSEFAEYERDIRRLNKVASFEGQAM